MSTLRYLFKFLKYKKLRIKYCSLSFFLFHLIFHVVHTGIILSLFSLCPCTHSFPVLILSLFSFFPCTHSFPVLILSLSSFFPVLIHSYNTVFSCGMASSRFFFSSSYWSVIVSISYSTIGTIVVTRLHRRRTYTQSYTKHFSFCFNL